VTHDPYAIALPAPALSLCLPEATPHGPLPSHCWAGDTGPGQSPQLQWSTPPDGARSLLITAYDADAPIPGGLWHWVLKDVPAHLTGLPRNAGAADGALLPTGSVHLPNDLGVTGYSGARPPAGTGMHRLFVAVTALDVEVLDVPAGASTALVHILAIPHTLARGVTVATAQAPPA
jgi:Raf kinase inhibitor-like YbhB/YbcL family protein